MAVFLESGDPTAHAPQLDSVLPTANFHLLFLNDPYYTVHLNKWPHRYISEHIDFSFSGKFLEVLG